MLRSVARKNHKIWCLPVLSQLHWRLRAGERAAGWTKSGADAIVRRAGLGGRQCGCRPGSGKEARVGMTIGTRIYTWLYGKKVGTDAFGNHYYCSKRNSLYGRERRWVVYSGTAEASKVPPEWHAWLHHLAEQPLTEAAAQARPWQKPHLPNLTGTPYAYFPPGHDLSGGKRAPATGDYEPWTPG